MLTSADVRVCDWPKPNEFWFKVVVSDVLRLPTLRVRASVVFWDCDRLRPVKYEFCWYCVFKVALIVPNRWTWFKLPLMSSAPRLLSCRL